MTVGATTHEQLLREAPISLPILNVGIPLFGFYWIAPALFVLLHFNLMLQFYLLARKLRAFEQALAPLPEHVQREHLGGLDTFAFSHMLIGIQHSRLFRTLFRLVVWITVIILPVILLLGVQIRFLPYHDAATTTFHRILMLLDLLLLWFIWRRVVSGPNMPPNAIRPDATDHATPILRRWRRVLHRSTRWVADAIFVGLTALVGLSSLFLFTFPSDPLEKMLFRWLGANSSEQGNAANGPGEGWCNRVLKNGKTPRQPSVFCPTQYLFENFPAFLRRNLEVPETSLVTVWPTTDQIDRFGEANAWQNFGQSVDLRGRDLRFGDFSASTLAYTDLRDADLQGAELSQANLQGSDLCDGEKCTNLQGADIEGANLQGADLGHVNLESFNLSDANLQNADLERAKLQGADLTGANLQGADLERAKLQGADLTGANLQNADLERAKLQGADLTGANLQGADLERANLQGADLTGANLQGADLGRTNSRLEAAEKTRGADLQGADLERADLRGADLRGVVLQGANLDRANLQGALLSNANLRAASFSYAKLQGARLTGADLRGAYLDDAYLQGADFQRAELWQTTLPDEVEAYRLTDLRTKTVKPREGKFQDWIHFAELEIVDEKTRAKVTKKLRDRLKEGQGNALDPDVVTELRKRSDVLFNSALNSELAEFLIKLSCGATATPAMAKAIGMGVVDAKRDFDFEGCIPFYTVDVAKELLRPGSCPPAKDLPSDLQDELLTYVEPPTDPRICLGP